MGTVKEYDLVRRESKIEAFDETLPLLAYSKRGLRDALLLATVQYGQACAAGNLDTRVRALRRLTRIHNELLRRVGGEESA